MSTYEMNRIAPINSGIPANNKRFRIPYKRIAKFISFKIVLPLVYAVFSAGKADPRLVVFADYRFRSMPDNMKALYEGLAARGYRTLAVLKRGGKGIRGKNFFSYLSFVKNAARAKYIVVNDYYPPLYAIRPRRGQKVIQIWHAAGAFKKFGYSTADKKWGASRQTLERYPIHNNYSHVIVSSSEVIPYYADAFNIGADRIYDYGLPRSDVFFHPGYRNECREKLYGLFQKAEGKKVILYAPTFRGVSAKSAVCGDMLDYAALEKAFGGDYVVITKFHPLAKPQFSEAENYGDFVKDVTDRMEINEAMACADILISDYSSLVFEFSLLERPMIFFAYDLREFIDERDFYYNYEDFVPGPIVEDNRGLIKAILDAEKSFDRKKVSMFREKFMHACDGHSTERIIDRVFERN